MVLRREMGGTQGLENGKNIESGEKEIKVNILF